MKSKPNSKFISFLFSINGILLIITLLGLFSQIIQYKIFPDYNVIHSDGVGYYYYLPSVFVHKNITKPNPIDMNGDILTTEGLNSFGISEYEESGKYIDKYPIGLAILLLPFFLIAHFLTTITNSYTSSFSGIYQLAIMLANLSYMALGFSFLYKLLKIYFQENTSKMLVVGLFLGTNLLYYVIHDTIFSHSYSFAFVSIFLYLIVKWHEKPDVKKSIFLGIVYGIIMMLRQANILFAILFILYGILKKEDLALKFKLFWNKRDLIFIIIISSLIAFFPQMLYWYAVTGKAFLYSYQSETFNFLKPHLIQTIFYPSRNMFYWFPLNFFGVLGLIVLWRRAFAKKLQSSFEKLNSINWIVSGSVFLILQIYLVSSWWLWTYGGGFGHRAFIEILPVWAIFVGVAIDKLFRSNRRIFWVILTAICILISFCITWLAMFEINIPDRFEKWLRPIVTEVVEAI